MFKENGNNFENIYGVNPYLLKLFTKEKNIPINRTPVSFDFDGVLGDSAVVVVDVLNKILGTTYTPSNINCYWGWVEKTFLKHQGALLRNKDMVMETLKEPGLFKGEKDVRYVAHALDRYLWESPEIIGEVPLMPGAKELVDLFYGLDLRPIYPTSRVPELTGVTWNSIKTHFPQASRQDLLIRSPQQRHIPGDVFKVGIIGVRCVPHHFEDHLQTGRNVSDQTHTSVTIVSAHYNRLEVEDRHRRMYRYNHHERTLWPIVSDLKTIMAAGYNYVAQCH